MNIPAKYRGWLYVGTVVVAAGAIVLGYVTPGQLTDAIQDATLFAAALMALLAKANVSPDAPKG